MSNNKFQTNSRFAALIENTNDITRTNDSRDDRRRNTRNDNTRNNNDSRRDDRKRDNSMTYENTRTNNRRDITNEEDKKLFEKLKKDQDIKKILSMDNFPELGNSSVVKNDTKNISFIDKLNTENPLKPIVNTGYEVKPGWVEIKKDKSTNKSIFRNIPSNKSLIKDSERINKIMNQLVSLYEERTNDYIDLWGHDEYEHVFKFPNYDYNYFDRLDEIYEDELSEGEELLEQKYEDNLVDDYYQK